MSELAVEMQNVERWLWPFKLGPLNLSAPRGSVYALIGPNGAGKTTTLDLLMGMGRSKAGAIRLLGRNLERDEVEIKRRVGYVSPDLNYHAWGRVGRALDFVSGFYPDWDDPKCERLLKDFGLRREEKIATLSFGAKIKLALVMALAREPELLILDEPTVGLDAVSRHTLFAELLAFMRRDDRTIIISSHQLSDLERLADHVGIIHHGKMLVEGRLDTVLNGYRQLDLQLGGHPLPQIAGMRLLSQEGDRARVMLHTPTLSPEALAAHGLKILAETSMSLEETFVALVKE